MTDLKVTVSGGCSQQMSEVLRRLADYFKTEGYGKVDVNTPQNPPFPWDGLTSDESVLIQYLPDTLGITKVEIGMFIQQGELAGGYTSILRIDEILSIDWVAQEMICHGSVTKLPDLKIQHRAGNPEYRVCLKSSRQVKFQMVADEGS